MKAAVLVLIASVWATQAAAQTRSIGGHVGVAVPLMSHGHDMTLVTDELNISVPIGIVLRKNTAVPIDTAIFTTRLHDGQMRVGLGVATAHPIGHNFNGAMGVLYNFHDSTWGIAPALDRVLRPLSGGQVILGDIFVPLVRAKDDDGSRYLSVGVVAHIGLAF